MFKKIIMMPILTLLSANANAVLPTFECTLSNEFNMLNDPYETIEYYSSRTKAVYLICESNNVRKGDTIRAVWIADKTDNVCWYNNVLSQSHRVVAYNLNVLDTYRPRFTLPRPACGWPKGQYHVMLYINGTEGNIYRFTLR